MLYDQKKISKNDGYDHKQPDSVLLSCTPGVLTIWQKISEILDRR